MSGQPLDLGNSFGIVKCHIHLTVMLWEVYVLLVTLGYIAGLLTTTCAFTSGSIPARFRPTHNHRSAHRCSINRVPKVFRSRYAFLPLIQYLPQVISEWIRSQPLCCYARSLCTVIFRRQEGRRTSVPGLRSVDSGWDPSGAAAFRKGSESIRREPQHCHCRIGLYAYPQNYNARRLFFQQYVVNEFATALL